MRCQSALCWRCAKVSADHGVSQVSQVRHAGGISRHSMLTVPAMFRPTFSHNAAVVLSALMRCGVQCLDEVFREVRGQPLRGGARVVLHTPGRQGPSPPPRHVLATNGGDDAPGAPWEHRQDWP